MKLTVCYDLLFDVDVPDTEVEKILKKDLDNLARGDALWPLIVDHMPANLSKVIDETEGEVTGIYNPDEMEYDEILYEN